MEHLDELELQDCPICGGAGLLEEECGSSYYVMCMDCGSETVRIDFRAEDERREACRRAAELWNTGKVIAFGPGE